AARRRRQQRHPIRPRPGLRGAPPVAARRTTRGAPAPNGGCRTFLASYRVSCSSFSLLLYCLKSLQLETHSFDGPFINRMDPKPSYLLEFRLSANPKKRRKDFSYFTFSKVVDSDLCNFKDFVREIVDQYPHGYQEVVHVFFTMMVSKNSLLKSQPIKNSLRCS